VLYSVNIPMIPGLLEQEGLKIYWTTVWRNGYGRLFEKAKVLPSPSPELKETFEGTDAETTAVEAVNGGTGLKEVNELVFKFSPDLSGILNPRDAPSGSDGWALAEGAVSVTALHATFAEKLGDEFRTVEDRVWKVKL